MHKLKNLIIFLLLATPVASAGDNHITIQSFISAFNNKDIDAMLAVASPDIAWMYIDGDSVHVESIGHQALRTAMTDYFKNFPSATSVLISTSNNGNFVTAIEKAHWLQDKQARSQCSASVYQLDSNRIVNVWYYPAETCD